MKLAILIMFATLAAVGAVESISERSDNNKILRSLKDLEGKPVKICEEMCETAQTPKSGVRVQLPNFRCMTKCLYMTKYNDACPSDTITTTKGFNKCRYVMRKKGTRGARQYFGRCMRRRFRECTKGRKLPANECRDECYRRIITDWEWKFIEFILGLSYRRFSTKICNVFKTYCFAVLKRAVY